MSTVGVGFCRLLAELGRDQPASQAWENSAAQFITQVVGLANHTNGLARGYRVEADEQFNSGS
jgi:hypothetical protein